MAIKRLYDTLVGATVNVNQLVVDGDFPDGTTKWNITDQQGTISVANNVLTVQSLSGSLAYVNIVQDAPTENMVIGHKYYYSIDTKSAKWASEGRKALIVLAGYWVEDISGDLSTSNWNTINGIWNSNQTNPIHATFRKINDEDLTPVSIRNFTVIDLTALLGSSIADYLYNLETATAGAGIAKLRSWGFLTDEYIPYNPGSLESVEATAHKMVGFNQWDEVWEVGGISGSTGADWATTDRIRGKNYVPVIPNAKYYIKSSANVNVMFYNADKAFISTLYFCPADNQPFTAPTDCYYIRFAEQAVYGTTYNHDICINLSSSRNGEYEPYSAHTYDLGTDTLRGLFKLDANNQLYAYGDVKTADGVITRKYGIRAYQSGDESLADAITDGTTTVYKLTTPTTEQGDPFPSPQVCYPDGTEEYVTSNGVPVGHETRYQL